MELQMYIFYISIDIRPIIDTNNRTNIRLVFIFTPVITAGREAEKLTHLTSYQLTVNVTIEQTVPMVT